MKTSYVAPEDAPRSGVGTGPKRQPDSLSLEIRDNLRRLKPGEVVVMEFDEGTNMDRIYQRVLYNRQRLGLEDVTKQWQNRTKVMVQKLG